jgi:hypothetical protein
MLRSRALGDVALAVGIVSLAACGDIFHATNWASRCDGDAPAADCDFGGQGAGAPGATGGSGDGGAGVGGGGGSGGGAVTFAAVCQSYAAAYCPRLAECRPFLHELVGGTAQCEARLAEACIASWSGAGLTMTAADLDACIDAIGYGSATCDHVLRASVGQVNVPECRIAGTRVDGQACLDGHQCQGLGCRPSGEGYCGTCFAVSEASGVCAVDVDCEPGLRCAMGSCVPLADTNEACASSVECFVDLACVGGACQPRSPEGAVCDPMNPTCAVDLYCGAGATCRSYLYAPEQGSCGSLPDGATGCLYGSYCEVTMAGESIGVCTAQGAEGQACPTAPSVFAGPCRYPSGCVDGSCVVAEASTCN